MQILLLFGGESSEHDVSVMSARNVYDAIDKDMFSVQLGYIDQQGGWWLLDRFDAYAQSLHTPLVPQLGSGTFLAGDTQIAPAALLPILHGKNGEDGSVQALGQLLHIPVVGCDMASSALGMDKVAAKRIAQQIGIEVAPYVVYRRGEELPSYDTIRAQLGDTLFVKPSRAGSSVGVSNVQSDEAFAAALQTALTVDSTVLIETALDVRELETAVLGVPPQHEVSRVGEILPGDEFYSYEDKYSQTSTASTQIPANIPGEVEARIREQAKRLFAELGGSGLSRIDFFLAGDGTVYFNEINTLPGFTSISMYPKLWQFEGVSYSDLITRLIESALEP